MDKFFNAFGFGLAIMLASTLATQSRESTVESTVESTLVPAAAVVVADPIAAQGNAAVRQIEEDARTAAREARPTAMEVAER